MIEVCIHDNISSALNHNLIDIDLYDKLTQIQLQVHAFNHRKLEHMTVTVYFLYGFHWNLRNQIS